MAETLAFEKTEEEAEVLTKNVRELNKTIEQTDPDEAIKQLDKFYKKLLEGNTILSIVNQSFSTDLLEDYRMGFANLTDGFNMEAFRDQVTESFGVTDEFFNKFLARGDLPKMVNDGLIQSEEELIAVIKAMITENSKLNKLYKK